VYAGFSIGSILGPQISKALLASTDVRSVLLVASALFAVSTLAVTFIESQPAARHAVQTGPRLSLTGALKPAYSFFSFVFVIGLSMTIGMQLIPNFLERIGWRLADVSGVGSAQALGIAILSVLVGHISAGRRRRGLLIAQALVWAAMVCFAFGAQAWGGLAAAGYFLLGGYQTARQQAAAQIAGYAPPEHRGTAFAIAETVGALALAAASLLSGVLFAADPVRPFYAAMLLIPIAILLTLRLRGPKQDLARQPGSEAEPVVPGI
jgi:MFS family permease